MTMINIQTNDTSNQKELLPDKCPTCGDPMTWTTYLGASFPSNECSCSRQRRQKWEEEQQREKESYRNARIQKLYDSSKLGKRFKERTFSTFDHEKDPVAFKKARSYTANFDENLKSGKGLVFVGSVGSGKTHLAGAIANNLIQRKERTVIFGTAVSLLGQIRDGIKRDAKVIDDLESCDLLIIDDLGKEQTTPWVLETLFSVINTRYERMLPIVVTTNYTLAELESMLGKIGEAVVSRLFETCERIQMTAQDYRKINFAKNPLKTPKNEMVIQSH